MTGKRAGLRAAGKAFFAVGLLLLAFVGYQLWGTSLSEHSAQSRLRSELAAQLHHRTPPASHHGASGAGDDIGADTVAPRTSTATDDLTVGSPVGFLSIPRIGLTNDVIVEGVGTDQLREGPGHYPGTPLPGQRGNAAIAGHRTTYAAPFYNLNELQPGDPITVQTVQGTFRYAVTQNTIVIPTDSAVLDSASTPELTLTTCNPRYSATQRLVIVAVLQSSRLTETSSGGHVITHKTTTPATPPSTGTLADSGGGSDVTGAVLWGLLFLAVALVGAVAWPRTRRQTRWGLIVIGTPVGLLVLFVFFGHVSAVLPASF